MARPNAKRTIGAEENLAQRIAHERAVRDWSYETLADRMGEVGCSINGSALYKIEKGKPRRGILVDELAALAKVFETTVENLLEPMDDRNDALSAALRQQAAERWDTLLGASYDYTSAMAELLEFKYRNKDVYEHALAHLPSNPELVVSRPWHNQNTGKVVDCTDETLQVALREYVNSLAQQAVQLATANLGADYARWKECQS